MGALLLMISMVTGSTLASTATGLQPIPALVNHYAEEHLTRGGILVGVDVRGETHWYSSGNLTSDTYFKIGSVTKTLTGMLLAAEISAGRVTEETTVGELWPERSESTGAAELAIPAVPEDLSEVTVGQLATHTSGLPRVNLTPRRLVRAVLRQDDPYAGLTATDVYRDAASASLGEPGTFQYSNLGYALLGVLLAADSAEPSSYTEQYLDAVHAGVLAPLGLPRFSITTNSEELPTAYTVNGRRAEYWTFDGYAAAGGVVASAADVLQYIASVHDLPSELTAAVQPHGEVGGERDIGYGWLIEELENGDTMIWHNGGTGGFRSFVATLPDRETSIAVFSNSAVSVDELGWAIARGRDRVEAPQTSTRMQWVIGGGLLLWLGWFAVSRLLKRRSTDVLTIVQSIIGALFVISVWARSAPPALYIPGIELLLGAVVAGVGVVQMVHTLQTGETMRFTGRRGPWQIFAVAAQIGVFGMLAVLLW